MVSISALVAFNLAGFCRTFKPGPFYLGKTASLIVNTIALTYVLFITAVFIMPTAFPVTSTSLNWAPVAVGIVLIWTFGYWLLPFWGARHWFKGPPAALELASMKP